MSDLFRRILVPYDFSDAATAALDVAVELAGRHHGALTVLHAIAPVYPVSAFPGAGEMPVWVPPDDVREETRARLEAAVAKRIGARGPDVTCRVVVGDPHHCIVEAARRADSIVMGTVGRTGLAHLLVGSVAEKVVRHSPVPVLTLRPTGRRHARARGTAGAARARGRTSRARPASTGNATVRGRRGK